VKGREILYRPDGFPGNRDQFHHGGNPLLFPSVGRTWDRGAVPPRPGIYRLHGDGKEYRMPIHGILPECSWAKISAHEREEYIRLEYRLFVPPEVRENCYPFDLEYRQVYILTATALKLEADFRNLGSRPVPFAFGLHPYFSLAGAERGAIEVRLPCSKRMELDPQLLIPSGAPPREACAAFRLEAGKGYDDGFVGMTGRRAEMVDRNADRTVSITVDGNIEAFLVYAPAGSPFVCLEPWTRGVGAFESLKEDGWWKADRPLPVLNAGESRRIEIYYAVHGKG
jgi:galactose mutarotase-like enzyme